MRDGTPLIADLAESPTAPHGARWAVLEEAEYLYQVEPLEPCDEVRLEPAEVFDPDTDDGLIGRLRPGPYTGTLTVEVAPTGGSGWTGLLEVRSRKLNYLEDYRWMLTGIASEAAELLMHRFAPAALRGFRPEEASTARTLYQRFAFLKSILDHEEFQAAVAHVLASPHHRFEDDLEERIPGRGLRGGSAVVRQLSRPGPKQSWPGSGPHDPLRLLPTRFEVRRFTASVDTEANRFVRFALEHWRGLCRAVAERLAIEKRTPAVDRGLREANETLERIDSILAQPLFREVARLDRFPGANQVLTKRQGYREILRAYVLSEAAARLEWEGGDDVFGAGQRDVATLYEYWCYLQLVGIVSTFCEGDLDTSPLIDLTDTGLALSLRRSGTPVLRGRTTRRGRQLEVALWFNRTFGRDRDRSWTLAMRPDCSLCIASTAYGQRQETWLHFDAKYRVERVVEILGSDVPEPEGEGAAETEVLGEKRADLLKMHAYRDAIRRSAGAYVLYPGTREKPRKPFKRYEEILPGLGAFALRPSPDGSADGAGTVALARFIGDVIDHLASQNSQLERARYWKDTAYRSPPAKPSLETSFLRQPPGDTRVLLGYVKSVEHLRWIHATRLYNLRADQRTGSIGADASALGAELLVLYNPERPEVEVWVRTGDPLLMTKENLVSRGYPLPGGDLYCCLQLGQRLDELLSEPLATERVEEVRRKLAPGAIRGVPVVVTWLSLIEEHHE